MQDIKKLIIDIEKIPHIIYIKSIDEKQPQSIKAEEDNNIENSNRSMDMENLTIEILEEMERVTHISNLTTFYIDNSEEELTSKDINDFNMTFKRIIKRCDKVCELTDNLRRKHCLTGHKT